MSALPLSPSGFRQGLVALTLLSLAGASSATAAIAISDPFTDGDLTEGPDNSGISWFDRSANSTIAIASDPAFGGNALVWNANNTATANRGIVATLPIALSLTTVGDYVTMNFKFRLAATQITAGNFTTTPNNNAQGFTFGFYDSNATAVTDNDQSFSDNDRGFRGAIGSGTTSAVSIRKETNTTAGELGSGTDTPLGLEAGSTPVAISDFNVHTGSITILLNNPGQVTVSISVDGNQIATSVPDTTTILTYDEIVFSQGGGNSFRLDDIEILSNIPEPSSALLVTSLGLLGCIGYRRR